FTGIAVGTLIGIVNPMISATIFSILFAIIITFIKNRSRVSTDTIIGVFSSLAIALGIIILSSLGGFQKYTSYLIGDLLSITKQEITNLAIVFVVIVIIWVVIYNRLLLVSVNASLAKSRGIKILPVEIIFTSMIAVIVTISIQWVGLLIINSLLILPAATARNISGNIRQYSLFAICISLFSGISGLILSYYMNTATGATIILISGLIFFVSLLYKKRA
ncbi:MAG: metal ABC transporter permease, partial [Saccharofermentanales bacterium]